MNTNKKFIAYYRVSTDKQGVSGLGLEAQKATVQDYRSNEQDYKYPIYLSKIKTNFGGFRWAFECPRCSKRRVKLYFKATQFRCRKCHNLVHESTRESYMNRLIRKTHKLRDEIDGDFLVYHKPKHMKWSKYNRLIEKLDRCDEKFAYEMLNRYGYVV